MIVTLLWLLIMHALCDGPLQGSVLSAAKCPDGVPGFPWQIALAAHNLLHAAAVALVTASWGWARRNSQRTQ